ncbi:MAG: hypothetical protein D6706_11015 [Chloroflexi bacterium]|nr:MAG: hypothetical protein D6706_11015 [Chloroflexota bacterium]
MNTKTTNWTRLLWLIAGVGFLVGLYGLYDRIVAGHAHAAYGSYVPWGLWVAAYTMLVGVSAGAFATAAVIYVRQRAPWYNVARTALLVALAALAGGMLSVLLDLGHPERFWRLFLSTNFTSIMGLMNWFYTAYGIILIVMLWYAWTNPHHASLRYLSFLAVPFAIMFSGAEGALFGVVGARPLWESGLTPILFLTEAALAGVAAVTVGAFLFDQLDDHKAGVLGRTLIALLAVLALFEWAEYSTGLYAGVPAKVEAMRTILFGPYWWVFWFIHLGLGIVAPLALLALGSINRITASIAGTFVVIAAIASKLNLIIPALAHAEIEGLEHAFTGPGLTFDYFPTLPEWMLFIWIVSLALLIFLGGNIMLPRIQKEVK